MALDLKIDGKRIAKNRNVVLFYFLLASFFSLLFIYSGQKAYAEISKIVKETKDMESDIHTLEGKIDLLKRVDQEGYGDISVLSLAFPEDNPIIFAYSQIKELSYQNSVVLSKVEFNLSGTGLDTISKSALNFEVYGLKRDVLKFLSDIETIAPVLGLGEMSFAQYTAPDGEFTLKTSVDIYYSPYPDILPSVDSALAPLNDSEKKIFKTLSDLRIIVNQDMKAGLTETSVDPFEIKGSSSNSGENAQEESP